MRKEYLAIVRKDFDDYMKTLRPSFEANYKGPGVLPGQRTYRMVVAENLMLFVGLVDFSSSQDFDIEIAWTEIGVFPRDSSGFMPKDPPKNGGTLIRLTSFYKPWRQPWLVEPREPHEETMARMSVGDYSQRDPTPFLPGIPAIVDEAWAGLVEYGLPYFERIAAEHGHEVRFEMQGQTNFAIKGVITTVGIVILPSFTKEITGFPRFNGTGLAYYMEDISTIPITPGAKHLWDFIEAGLGEVEEYVDHETYIARKTWYDPQEGLDAIQAVVQYVNENSEYVADPDWLFFDLDALKVLLMKAQEIDFRFMLAICD